MLRHAIPKNNHMVNGYSLEQMEEFKYLGINIEKEYSMHNEIKLRTSASNRS